MLWLLKMAQNLLLITYSDFIALIFLEENLNIFDFKSALLIHLISYF